MRCAYSAILISSLLVITGCAAVRGGDLDHSTPLPSLRDLKPLHIAQMNPEDDPQNTHTSPFFIVCLGDDCPVPTVKTPVKTLPIIAAATTSDHSHAKPSRRSNSYFKKSIKILSQYRVHFDYASATLNADDKALLKQFMKDYPQMGNILITGFTDSGSKANGTVDNHWLALERALSVKKTLIDLGYPESQILLEAKFLCCYIDSNESEAGRHNNRRAEISLIKTLTQH